LVRNRVRPEEKTFFGYVSIFGDWNDEWGYFSLAELESYVRPWGIGIERDLYWTEAKASQSFAKEPHGLKSLFLGFGRGNRLLRT
jgi:hypothetical protein